jgi:hypothetical protein
MMRTVPDPAGEQVVRASFNYPGAKRSIVDFANVLQKLKPSQIRKEAKLINNNPEMLDPMDAHSFVDPITQSDDSMPKKRHVRHKSRHEEERPRSRSVNRPEREAPPSQIQNLRRAKKVTIHEDSEQSESKIKIDYGVMNHSQSQSSMNTSEVSSKRSKGSKKKGY